MPYHIEVTPNPAEKPEWFCPVQFEADDPVRYQTMAIAEAVAESLRERAAGIAGYRVRVVLAPANPPR